MKARAALQISSHFTVTLSKDAGQAYDQLIHKEEEKYHVLETDKTLSFTKGRLDFNSQQGANDPTKPHLETDYTGTSIGCLFSVTVWKKQKP